MEKILTLIPASDADDLTCKDGELENSHIFFPPDSADADDDDSSEGNDDDPTKPSTTLFYLLDVTPTTPLPADARYIAVHGQPLTVPNHILQLADGRLAFIPDGASAPVNISPAPVRSVLKVTACGLLLTFVTPTGSLFAQWNGSAYDWLGEPPAPPAATFSARSKALPPYSTADGQLPVISVAAAAGADMSKAINEAKNRFLAAVAVAGLHIDPVYAAACWRLADGGLRAVSEPRRVGDDSPLTLRTLSSDYHDGVTYLTLEVSRAPFEVVMSVPSPYPWPGFIEGPELLIAAEPDALPDIAGFDTGFGFGVSLPADALYVTASLSSPAAGGSRSLFIFRPSGIYRDSRFFSRHVALGPDSFAPLPDGTAFITEAGVMKLSGTTVRQLSGPVCKGLELGVSSRLLYLYKEDVLVVYNPGGDMRALVDGEWVSVESPTPDDRHYAWPATYVSLPGLIGRPSLTSHLPTTPTSQLPTTPTSQTPTSLTSQPPTSPTSQLPSANFY